MSKRNFIILIVFNLILLAELVFSLYQASKNPESVTLVFLTYFLILVIPTFIIGRIIVKKLLTHPLPSTMETLDTQLEEQKALYAKLIENEKPFSEYLKKPEIVNNILKKRELIGKLSIIFIILLMFSFLDGCVNKLLHPPNLLDLMPGQSVDVNAPLEKRTEIHELTYNTTSEDIQLKFDSVYSGFWLGGTEWKGVLTVSPNIKPGQYQVTVNTKEGQKFPFVFFVRIHENKESIQKVSMSLIKKISGLSSWSVFILSAFLIAITALYILKLSNKIEKVMIQNGQAEVFFVKKGQFVIEVIFGLGNKNNIKPGDVLNIYTDKGQPVGNVIVQRSTDKDSIGIVKAEYNVKPGFIVAVKK